MSYAFEVDKAFEYEFDTVEAKDLAVGDIIFHDKYCAFYDLRGSIESAYAPGELILNMIRRADQFLLADAPVAVTIMVLPVAQMHRVRPC